MPNKIIEKNFPADTALHYDDDGNKTTTFLSNPKIDAELYNYLLSISYGIQKETRVYKKDMKPIAELAKDYNLSRQTLYNHLNYLKEKQYIEDCTTYYKILPKEKIHFRMPLALSEYFRDNAKEALLKIYIYLGQKNSYKPNGYEFTIKELCEHIGINYERTANRESVRNRLIALKKWNLIDFVAYRDANLMPKMKLTKFSTQAPTDEEIQKNREMEE